MDERVDELSNSFAIESSSSPLSRQIDQHEQPEPQSLQSHVVPRTRSSTTQIVEGASLLRAVDTELKEFDGSVEIIDSVMVDHVSEDDKSTSSEEVTYERWTEETRLKRTRVFDEHGRIIDEYVQQVRPAELVGDIVRERLIERHEHVKRVSKNVLRRVKVKSLSSLESTDGRRTTTSGGKCSGYEHDNDNDDVIIVEPHDTRRHQDDSTYFIQHQQVIKPPPPLNSSSSLSSGVPRHRRCSGVDNGVDGDDDQHLICEQNCVRILAAPPYLAASASSASSSSSTSSSPTCANNSASATNHKNDAANSCTPPPTFSLVATERPRFSLDLINAVLNMSIKENRSSPPNLSSLLRNALCLLLMFI